MITKTCMRESCNNAFTRKDSRQKYCSRSCAITTINTGRRRHPLRYCSCGNTLATRAKNCPDCKRSHTERWLTGELSPSYKNGELKSFVKKYLIKQADNKCSKCKWCEPNPVLGYPILTIDHIDGNWRNNSIDNLVVLCFNCHSLTTTFGRLNTNSTNRARGRRT